MVELNFENDRFGEILEFGAFGVQSIFYPASQDTPQLAEPELTRTVSGPRSPAVNSTEIDTKSIG